MEILTNENASKWGWPEIMEHLTPEQETELINNCEVLDLIRHRKRWKYYTFCQIPYRLLAAYKTRYDWKEVTPKNFDNTAIRLRANWKIEINNKD